MPVLPELMTDLSPTRQAVLETSAPMDWTGGGLLLSILGCFLLASALLLRPPRELLAQHLGGRHRPLTSLRGFLFQRVQVSIGFLVLLLGFNFQLVGHLHPVPEELRHFPLGWAGGIAVLLVLLEVAGWWYARRQFQRAVRQYLVEQDLELESDTKLAREVGELFGVELEPEDTVRRYAQKVRERAGLPSQRPRRSRRPDEPQGDLEGFDEEELPEHQTAGGQLEGPGGLQ